MIKKIFIGSFAVLMITALAIELATVGNVSSSEIKAGNSTISVEMNGTAFDVGSERILQWVRDSARAVEGYYGKFPVPHVQLQIRETGGRGVRNGVTYGESDGGRIRISVGRSISDEKLKDDWMLTHELVHLAFPYMEDAHHWIEEGIATYVEPWGRVRAGLLTPSKAWHDLARDVPQGQPEAGDRGLDLTHTWGRTYWGGALFCLVADVQIRERTQNKKGLIDALRAINLQSSLSHSMDIRDALKIGDAGTGVSVLGELYDQMATHPEPVDLDQLWSKLGVKIDGDEISFDDKAPLASVRHAIEGKN